MFIEPYIAAIVLFCVATALGIAPVVKIISVYEAKHELKHGSAGFIRSISGWAIIAFWILTTWFVATILGDWAATQDLTGAIDRGMLRLRILLEIFAALAESD